MSDNELNGFIKMVCAALDTITDGVPVCAIILPRGDEPGTVDAQGQAALVWPSEFPEEMRWLLLSRALDAEKKNLVMRKVITPYGLRDREEP